MGDVANEDAYISLTDIAKYKNPDNAFTLTPQQWIKATDAIGIISKSGRYGGTYAHTDIAFEFASWILPEFKLYIIKDYQRLKKDEADRIAIGWDAKKGAFKDKLSDSYGRSKRVSNNTYVISAGNGLYICFRGGYS